MFIQNEISLLHYVDYQTRKKYLVNNDKITFSTPNFNYNSHALTPSLVLNPMLRKPLDLR
jgi:hypothetical protein